MQQLYYLRSFLNNADRITNKDYQQCVANLINAYTQIMTTHCHVARTDAESAREDGENHTLSEEGLIHLLSSYLPERSRSFWNIRALQTAIVQLLHYRFERKLDWPLALKEITSWNFNRWTLTQQDARAPAKDKKVFIALKKGPVLLQETNWKEGDRQALLISIIPLYRLSQVIQ